jgi:hypothetical protein
MGLIVINLSAYELWTINIKNYQPQKLILFGLFSDFLAHQLST